MHTTTQNNSEYRDLSVAAQDADFKKCCMRSGRYDGALRNHYER
jgi:hypothetical protein